MTLFLIILPAVPVFFQRRGFVLAAGGSGLLHVLKTRWSFAMRDEIRLVQPHVSDLSECRAAATVQNRRRFAIILVRPPHTWAFTAKALFLATTLVKSCLDSVVVAF